MKHLLKLSALSLFLVLGSFAGGFYDSPEAAANNSRELQNYLDQGYYVENSITHQAVYKMAPSGHYQWGMVEIFLAKPDAPAVRIEASIEASDNNGSLRFKVKNVTVVSYTRT